MMCPPCRQVAPWTGRGAFLMIVDGIVWAAKRGRRRHRIAGWRPPTAARSQSHARHSRLLGLAAILVEKTANSTPLSPCFPRRSTRKSLLGASSGRPRGARLELDVLGGAPDLVDLVGLEDPGRARGRDE